MVQVTFDTSKDTVEELEASLRMLQDAVARRKGKARAPKLDMPQTAPEESAIDTPFFKITVKDKHEEKQEPVTDESAPTLSQLLTDESITEQELSRMFKDEGGKVESEEPVEQKDPSPSYIEIVEYTDEKES